ncbi:AMP-binding protein [Shigella flexneri]
MKAEKPEVHPSKHVILLKHRRQHPLARGRDLWWNDLIQNASEQHQPEEMNAEDPLFILYTSGSTGKPKGVLHTTGGYLVYAATTFKYVFDYHPGDIYWCTADVGWVTGQATCCMAARLRRNDANVEGVPNWPTPARMCQVVDKHHVIPLHRANGNPCADGGRR